MALRVKNPFVQSLPMLARLSRARFAEWVDRLAQARERCSLAMPASLVGVEQLEPRMMFSATDGPVAWWKLDGNALDSSGNKYNGVIVGDPVWHNAEGVVELSGDDRINRTNATLLNRSVTPQRTVMLWFNAASLPTGEDDPRILYEEGGAQRGMNIFLRDGTLWVGGWNRQVTESNWQGTFLQAPVGSVETGQWHHVAVTLDAGVTLGSGSITGYLDGAVFASGPASQLWPRNETGMGDRYEGTRFDANSEVAGQDSGGYGFVGKLDDIRVYNRVLTETEITEQTSPEPPAAPPENPYFENPVAWWKLDGDAKDSSGYKHHGVVVGDPVWQSSDGVLQLSGDDRVQRNNATLLNRSITPQRTVMLWFNAASLPTGGNAPRILYEEGGARRGLNIFLRDGTLWVGGWNREASESNWQGTFLQAPVGSVEAGQWHHVAVSLDAGVLLRSGQITGYLDGEVFGSGDASQLWPRSEIGLGDRYVGTRFDAFAEFAAEDSGGYGFIGQLDDIRVYNRALTAAEITGATIPELSISVTPVELAETPAPAPGGIPTQAVITVTSSKSLGAPFTLQLSGEAVEDEDYTIEGIPRIDPETGSAQFTLTTISDDEWEGMELVDLTIAPSPNYTVAAPENGGTAQVKIWDADHNGDQDDDGLITRDEVETHLTDPLNPDTDDDDLDDGLEVQIGTDPLYFDTDDDLLGDGWEYQYWDKTPGGAFNPTMPDDPEGDADGDDLNNFDEYKYGANPKKKDSDDDGVEDDDEANQGSDPNDPADQGKPPADDMKSKFTLTIGDPSGSESERWRLRLRDLGEVTPGAVSPAHESPDFGAVGSDDYWLQVGESYEITVEHIGTKSEFRNEYGGANYDWLAAVNPVNSAFPYFVIDPFSTAPEIDGEGGDDYQLLQTWIWDVIGKPNLAEDKKAYLHLPMLDVDIDSDNDSGFTPPPGEIDDEDRTEQDATTGKLLFANTGDLDQDDVPDYADFDGIAGAKFVPIKLKLSENVTHAEASDIKLTFNYASYASDPTGLQPDPQTGLYPPPKPGSIRLWTENGSAARNPNTTYLKPGELYSASDDLGLDPGDTVTVYIEAVEGSTSPIPITVNAVVDGDVWNGTLQDTVHVSPFDVNLTVDSNNDGVIDARDETIEEDSDKPGKIGSVNDGDEDSDHVPDYADGFNLISELETDNATSGSSLVPVKVHLTQLPQAKVRFNYDGPTSGAAAAPSGDGTDANPYIFTPPTGQMRLWTRRDGTRNPASVVSGGHYIQPGQVIDAALLNGDLWAELLTPSASLGDVSITVELDIDGDATADAQDTVKLMAVKIDLDIDSDNSGPYAAPQGSVTEDWLEAQSDSFGKPIPVNNLDGNGNQQPDYLDGYSLPDQNGVAPPQGQQFTPLHIRIPQGIDPERLQLQLVYSGQLSLTHPISQSLGGKIRIWTKLGSQMRNGLPINEEGDYIKPGIAFKADLLTFQNGVAELWVEAVAPSSQVGDSPIIYRVTYLDPNDNPILSLGEDTVRITTGYERDSWHNQALANAGINIGQWNPNGGFPATKQIVENVYQFYTDAFNEHPSKLLWAGLAKMAGGAVYKGLIAQREMIDTFADWLAHPLLHTQDELDTAAVMIPILESQEKRFLRMHKAIFEDLAWQHQAIIDGVLLRSSSWIDSINSNSAFKHRHFQNGRISIVDNLRKSKPETQRC